MRQRIDISDVESTTKIRAKYLRALENEEWDLLPGPTFVKSFLRTYADALGLDGKLLIEEYKLRHERLSDVDLQPIVPPGGRTGRGVGIGGRERRRAPRPMIPRAWAVAVLVAGLVVAVYLVGVLGSDDAPDGAGENRVVTTPGASTGAGANADARTDRGTSTGEAPARRLVRVQIVATDQVYVCLEAAGPRRLVPGVILTNGAPAGPFRSSRFRLMLGNSAVRLVVDGRRIDVPPVTDGIGYEITPTAVRRLPRASWPSCPTA